MNVRLSRWLLDSFLGPNAPQIIFGHPANLSGDSHLAPRFLTRQYVALDSGFRKEDDRRGGRRFVMQRAHCADDDGRAPSADQALMYPTFAAVAVSNFPPELELGGNFDGQAPSHEDPGDRIPHARTRADVDAFRPQRCESRHIGLGCHKCRQRRSHQEAEDQKTCANLRHCSMEGRNYAHLPARM